MLAALSTRLGVELAPARMKYEPGRYVNIDGASSDRTVLVECYARHGVLKPAQQHKVATDALKLSWLASRLTPTPRRLILCFADEQAARFLGGRGWTGQAVADLGLEVYVTPLDEATVQLLLNAQVRQYR